MTTEIVLDPIVNEQNIFPQDWVKHLGIDKKQVKVRLVDNMIVVEAVEVEAKDWGVESISFADLDADTQAAVVADRKKYEETGPGGFLSFDEVFN